MAGASRFAAIDAATITSLTIQQMDDYFTFDAGNVVLQSGMTFRGAKLAYQTYGKLNEDKSNVILYMTSFAAHHYDSHTTATAGRTSPWRTTCASSIGS